MHRKYVISLLPGLLCCIILWAASCIAKDAQPIKVAILPCSDVVKTFERFKPLLDNIEKDTGLKVKAIFPKDEKDLLRLFRKNSVDFILHSPYGYSEIKDYIDPQSLLKALGTDGKDYEIGYIIARKDSGLKTIQDLKGKNILLGMECSASRWIFARTLFEQNGMDIDDDLGSYVDGGCCEDISFNIYLKAADAGLVYKHYIDEQVAKGTGHVVDLAIIAESLPSPTQIFAAHKETPRAIIDLVYKSLKAIDRNNPKYSTLLTTTEIGGFVRAHPEEYESLDDS